MLSITFDAGGNSKDYTREGWSWPEARYTWATGPRSFLIVPPIEEGAKTVSIVVAPFISRVRPIQRIQLIINDIATDWKEVDCEGVHRIDFMVPRSIFSRTHENEIIIYHPDFASPLEVGSSGDWREISLALFSLEIKQVDLVKDNDDATESTNFFEGLIRQFESIGDNCEFGLLQRAIGVETLGLLRFAGVNFDGLKRLLIENFEGFGELPNIGINGSSEGEYMINDLLYGINYHTFTMVNKATPEDTILRQTRRLKFLTRKFREDIEAGEKILVYKQAELPSDSQVEDLLSAIRRHGNSRLFWVGLVDTEHPGGKVTLMENGVLRAFLPRFSPLANKSLIDVDGWLEICQQAYRLHLANIW